MDIKLPLSITFLIFSFLILIGFKYNLNVETAEIVALRFSNVLMFGCVLILTYLISLTLTKNYVISLISSFCLIFTPLFTNSLVGWTHTSSTFFILLGVYSFLRFLNEKKMKFLSLLGFCIGFLFTIRYLDTLFFLPFFLYLTFYLLKTKKYSSFILFLFVIFLSALPAFLFHSICFGNPLLSPYHLRPYSLPPHPRSNIVEFRFDRLPLNLYNIFVEFRPENVLPSKEDTDYKFRFFKSSLFQSSPFLVFAIPGIVIVRKFLSKKVYWLILTSILIFTIFYGSWKFYGGGWTTNMRYFCPLLPFLSLFASFFIFRKVKIKKINRYYFLLIISIFIILSKILFQELQEQSYYSPFHPKQFMNRLNFSVYVILFFFSLVAYHYLKKYKKLINYLLLSVFLILMFLGFVMTFFVDAYFSFYGSKTKLFVFSLMENDYILIFTFLFTIITLLTLIRVEK